MPGLQAQVRLFLVNRYSIFLLFAMLYPGIVEWLHGKSFEWITFVGEASLWLEIPFVMYLYYLLNRWLKPNSLQPFLAAFPILLSYLIYDLYFLMYGKSIRLIEITELPELMDVFPPLYYVLLGIFVGLPVVLFLINLDYRSFRQQIIHALPLWALMTLIIFSPETFAKWFSKIGTVNAWSDEENVSNNGRFAMTLYSEARRRKVNQDLEQIRDRKAYIIENRNHIADVSAKISQKRNVHLIVLESFLDPNMFANVSYSRNPMHETLSPFYRENSWSISSVFAGGTSQSEFELLCGVPAFAEYTAVEFNSFTGSAAYCLPGMLEEMGYRTIASNAYKPSFFNTIPAYKGIGFGEIYFSREYDRASPTYLTTGDIHKERFMYDGHLFDQNYNFLFGAKNQVGDKPTFNYILGVFGHFPHHIDESIRPPVVEMQSSVKDGMLARYANQYYYRTQELATYLNRLQERDPDSLIIAISDHLPPLSRGSESYHKLGYLENREDSIHFNRVIILDRGEQKIYPNMHHFDVPDIILDALTAGAHCQSNTCNHLSEDRPVKREDFRPRYTHIMAHATE